MEIRPEIIESYKEAFRDRLREIMNGKSTLQFSKDTGIPDTTLTNWLLKKSLPKIEYLVAIAVQFDVSIDYLIGLSDD